MKTAYYLLAASTLLLTFSCISSTGPDDPETVPPTVPVVTTADFTDLTTSSVKVGGEVKEDGGAEVTARGIVYGDQANPTVEASSITDEGTGTGVFESVLSELKASTTYYYRAYATNEAGTAYGEEKTFMTDMAEALTIAINDNVSLEMVLVKPGTFAMGNPQWESGFYYEGPVHNVTLTKSYYIGKFEVTQAQWTAIMDSNPSYDIGDDIAVHQVSYNMCLQFVEGLNKKTGLTFSMPTEAQWEFAARGGVNSKGYMYAGSNDLAEVGWSMTTLAAEGIESTMPGGKKKPNELGLYDMSGNVNEWVSDYFYSSGYEAGDATDPTGPAEPSSEAKERVVRGGSGFLDDIFCTVYKRVGTYTSDNAGMDFGLRLVLNNDK